MLVHRWVVLSLDEVRVQPPGQCYRSVGMQSPDAQLKTLPCWGRVRCGQVVATLESLYSQHVGEGRVPAPARLSKQLLAGTQLRCGGPMP